MKKLFDNKALAALIIPLIIEQLLAVLVGMADSIMVASVGEAAVSGVSLVDNLMVLIINIFAALATGGAVVAGQYLGQQREKNACKAENQLIWFILIFALVITGIVYLGKDFILHSVFGKIEPDVMRNAKTYLLIVAAVLIQVLLCNESRVLHLKKTLKYRPDKSMIKRILTIGIPNGLENSMFQLGKLMVLSLVSTFGTYAIAANAVGLFQLLPGMSISLAITTVISRCVGAGDYEQAKYYTKKLILITYVCKLAAGILIFATLPYILKAYNLSAVTAAEAEKILIFHGCATMLIWPLAFSLPSVFRASGDVGYSMTISIVSMWVCRIGFSYILGRHFGMGVFGVWVAMIIDWCFRSICFIWRYFSGKWYGKQAV